MTNIETEINHQPAEPPKAERTAPGELFEQEEVGGPEGPEPTRFGDWERKGHCVDF